MKRSVTVALAALATAGVTRAIASPSRSSAATIAANFSALGQVYSGIGALSGGGGVTRMVIDYAPAIQTELFDALFKPNAGASLQIIKVEIGGDTQSTEGTEASHKHTRDDLNCSRGYEWLVLKEAKLRNPAITTFGLSWGVPGWIGNGDYWSQDNIEYHTSWLDCARNTWGIEIDYMGIWNERYSNQPNALQWIKDLRAALDDGGFANTAIVASDAGWNIADDMTSDPSLSVAISVIGAHYPARPSEAAYALQSGSHKPLWASEMWNLGNVNDYPGALQLAHDLGTQAVQGMSSSIVWCLIHSWYSILPFSRTTDTNAGAGHALLTAAEPWSGHWQINPTLAAVAHHTQFAQPDWTYLAVGSGTGYIDAGNTSTIVALVNTNVPGGMLECSFVIETQHLPAPMSVTIALGGVAQGTVLPSVMHLWATVDEDHQLVALADVPVSGDGTVTFPVVPSAMYSLTTTTGQGFVVPAAPIAPSAAFPFPYSDSFTTYPSGGYPLYTADEGGLFVVDPTPPALGGAHALHQVVTQVPIVWERNPDPYTLLGNMNNFPSSGWSDYAVAITAAIDSAAAPQPPAGPSVASSMQPCNAASRSQQWAASTGALTASPALLVSVAYPGMCLGNTGATDYNASDTPTVGLVPCNLTVGASAGGTPTLHHWSLQGAHIVAAEGGQCLDVGGGSLAAGASAVTYGCKPPGGDDNQRWTVQGAPSAQQLRSTFDGMCLDLAPAPPPPPPVAPYLMLCARIGKYERNGPPPSGYCLTVTASANATASGAWALAFGTQRLASGATPTPVTQGTWHTLRVACAGDAVTASLDGATLGSGAVAGQKLSAYGMVALGSGWHEAWFKDLVIA